MSCVTLILVSSLIHQRIGGGKLQVPTPLEPRGRLAVRDYSSHVSNSVIGNLTEDFDGTIWIRQLRKQSFIVLEAANRICQQAAKPSRIFSFRLRHVAYTHFEVFSIGVHSTHHNLVPKDELQVDAICRNLNHSVTTRDARKHQNTILGECLHAVENHAGTPRGFKDHVERTKSLCALHDRCLLGDLITGTEGLN